MLTRETCVGRAAIAFAALNVTLMTATAARAADAPASGAEEELGEVVITGSRLATGFDMPTPVAIYNAEELATASPNNMAEALGQLPSLGGSVQASTSGQGSGTSGANGQSLLNLRQLGANRTLVLLDGQRMGVTNAGNSVDIGIIPQNLVKRVDIVTGGASASYGSDAVSGAVNFVLDTGFQGLKTEVNGGITTYHDNKNGKISVAYGKNFGRGRLVASGEYFKMGGMNYGEETGRYWFDHPTGAWANPTPGARPTTVLVSDAKSEFGSYGGTITAVGGAGCPAGVPGDTCRTLINKQFLAGGVLAPYTLGASHALFAGGGEGAVVNQPFTPDTLRRSLFVHGEFDVNPSLTLWAQGSYNTNVTFLNSQVVSQLTNLQFAIQEGNAYLPASVSSVLASTAGNQTLSLSRYDLDMGLQQDYSNVIVRRLSLGAKGRINDRWTFDTTVTQQNTAQILDIKVSDQRRLYAAADAVTLPNGQIGCRSSYYASTTSTVFLPNGSGMDPGCVPLNLFGNGSVSQAAADYVMGINTADVKLKQTTFDLNVRGDFGEAVALPAGPISFATGMNYRRITALRTVDALSNIYLDGTGVRGFPTGLQNRYGGYQFYNPSPLSGRVTVTEGYVEFGVPLLKDLPLVKSLATTLAGRLSDYSQSGVENMWKLGLNWTLNNSIRVRGTVSADTRAPTVLELFNTAQVTRGSQRFPSSSAASQIQAAGQTIAIGNPSLTPEHARTYTAGFVVTPSALPSFQASLDWYKIKITDQISAPGNQNVIDRCYAGDQTYCKLILINGLAVTTTAGVTAADFPTITNPTLNQPAKVSTSGLDFAAAWSHSLGSGKLGLRLNGNDLLAVEDPGNGCPVGALGPVTNYVGSIGNGCGNYPKITGRVSANYDIGRVGVGITERYIDKGKINPTYVAGYDITFNDVPAIWYTDLNLTYGLGTLFSGQGTLFLNVTNAFNKHPPVTTSSSRSWIVPTEFALYDVQGRRYVLGARFNW